MIIFLFSLCSVLFLPEPLLGFMDAVHGCRNSFIRRFFLPITLAQKGRICRKYTSSRRIKRDSGPLHLIKHNGDGRE